MKRRNYYLPFFLAAFIFTVLILSSCQTSRHVNKSQVTTQERTETVATATITERVDTSLVIKPAHLEAYKAISEILAGDTLQEETADFLVRTHYDPVKKRIVTLATTKAQVIRFKFNRVTVAKTRVATEKKTVIKEKTFEKETSWFSWWWLLLLLIPAGWWVYKKSRPV